MNKTKQRPVTLQDLRKHPERIERRRITIHGHGLEHRSSTTIYFNCVFCGTEIKAYMWSLYGCGKRCLKCEAFYTGSGYGIQWKDKVQNDEKVIIR